MEPEIKRQIAAIFVRYLFSLAALFFTYIVLIFFFLYVKMFHGKIDENQMAKLLVGRVNEFGDLRTTQRATVYKKFQRLFLALIHIISRLPKEMKQIRRTSNNGKEDGWGNILKKFD